jgi:hypothetical protein
MGRFARVVPSLHPAPGIGFDPGVHRPPRTLGVRQTGRLERRPKRGALLDVPDVFEGRRLALDQTPPFERVVQREADSGRSHEPREGDASPPPSAVVAAQCGQQ